MSVLNELGRGRRRVCKNTFLSKTQLGECIFYALLQLGKVLFVEGFNNSLELLQLFRDSYLICSREVQRVPTVTKDLNKFVMLIQVSEEFKWSLLLRPRLIEENTAGTVVRDSRNAKDPDRLWKLLKPCCISEDSIQFL